MSFTPPTHSATQSATQPATQSDTQPDATTTTAPHTAPQDAHEALALFLRWVWSGQPLSHLKINLEKLGASGEGGVLRGKKGNSLAGDGGSASSGSPLVRPARILLAVL